MSLFRPLREVITFRGGGTPSKTVTEYWDGAIPWATVKDFTSTKISTTQDRITEAGLHNSSANLIPRGHVIIPTRMSLGKAAINEVDLAINQDLRALIPKEPVDTSYLLHAILSLKDTIVRKGSGATVKGISQNELYGLEIFFPPLDDQIRIAHLLGKVEGLIAQRKQQLQQLDDLLKSVFLEMFGDPVRNEKGWTTGTSTVYANFVTVGVVVKPASHYVEKGAVALRSLNIKPNRIDTSDVVYFSNEANDGLLSKSKLKSGDVVIVRTGKTGTAAVVPSWLDGANCIDLIVVRPKREKLNAQFLSWLLNSERGQALVASREVGGIQKHFNVGALNSIPFPLPTIDLQNQFAGIVEKVESLKSCYQQSLTDLEALYGALSQQAFKGELDLSRVPMPNAEPQEPPTAIPGVPPSPADLPNAIHLPDTELLLATLGDRERLKELLPFWLEAYRAQLHGAAFSAQAFLAAAQTRIAELHPDNDFELGADAYEQVKGWVFESLASSRLTQGYADADNRVTLASQSPDWGTW